MTKPVLLVTGGSRGIGAAIARLAAVRGHDVALTYAKDEAAARSVVGEITALGSRAIAIKADARSEADTLRAFAEVDRFGSLAALVFNSAVTGAHSRLDDAATETLREVLDVNVLGALLYAREAIRRISTSHGGSGGTITFLSSRASFYGSPGEYVWYAASKGAIDSLTLGLAREVGREGIRVNAVSPGPIDTQMHRPGRLAVGIERSAMGRAGTPEEVAEAVLFLASTGASYTTGTNLSVAGGY